MQRLLPMALVLGLLVATAAAFGVTETLKLAKSPITGLREFKPFSPTCHCPKARELLEFRLRTGDDVTLTILDSGRRHVVRTVASGKSVPRGWRTFVWDGRTDEGAVAPDGRYYARLALARQRKGITIPNTIVVDTQAPKVVAAKPNRTTFSPDGDGQSDSVTFAYRLNGPAHATLDLGRRRIAYTRFAPKQGTIAWYGRMNGVALPAGLYRLRVGGVDAAGNAARRAGSLFYTVRIRYIAPSHRRYAVTAGTRFGVRVETNARRFSWRLGARSGSSRARVLVLRAPARAGRYTLVLSEAGHSSAAAVVVRPRR